MVLGKESKCVKINLPNGKVVDVLNTVLDEISKWIQDDNMKPEAGDTLSDTSIANLEI